MIFNWFKWSKCKHVLAHANSCVPKESEIEGQISGMCEKECEQARNLRRCALKAGKTLTRKTENLAHLTYPHTESGMR